MPAEPHPKPPETDEPKLPLIALVESNDDLRFALRENLQQHGFKVQDYPSGEALLESLEETQSERPDVYLLDNGIPGGQDGTEIAKILKENPNPDISNAPIFVHSATLYTPKERLRLGILDKFDFEQTIALIQTALKPRDK